MARADDLRDVARLFHEAGTHGVTRDQIAQHVEKDKRTADRLVKALRDAGATIERNRPAGGAVFRFVMTQPPNWDRRISIQARLALNVAALSVEQGGSQRFRALLERLEHMAEDQMTQRDRNLFQVLARRVRVGGGVNDPVEPDDRIFQALLKGIGETGVPRRLEIRYKGPYAKHAEDLTTHEVIPWGIIQDLLSGGTFLLGWNTGKNSLSYLRLSRIDSVRVREQASLPHPEDVERAATYQIGGWFSIEAPFEVRARIRGANWVRALQEAPPNLPDFDIRASRTSSAEISFKTNSLKGAKRWLLQMGADVEVLAPAELRTAVLADLQSALEGYRA
jgi:predicted DNA-binding transcriptional regulator YafY